MLACLISMFAMSFQVLDVGNSVPYGRVLLRFLQDGHHTVYLCKTRRTWTSLVQMLQSREACLICCTAAGNVTESEASKFRSCAAAYRESYPPMPTETSAGAGRRQSAHTKDGASSAPQAKEEPHQRGLPELPGLQPHLSSLKPNGALFSWGWSISDQNSCQLPRAQTFCEVLHGGCSIMEDSQSPAVFQA